MAPSDDDDSPVRVREGSPLSVDEKRAMIRELDRAVRYGAPGVETSTWSTFPGCSVTFALAEHERIEVHIAYRESDLPGPVTVPSVEGDASSLVAQGAPPTPFIQLSAAHGTLYEDLTDAAGRAVDPYAVTVPDSPAAQTATDGVVTFVATLELLTGQSSAERRTFEWG
ncbi:hypothetical protein [Halobaculum marinum]|uniref:Halobacterial output domain-containing protein n=1 Tax=Halobaculum marinum TaxID=3031996 RepID=A0ABD5WS60_9EURY|nr:hypothetical protein [Halobaculum sp. DT55]